MKIKLRFLFLTIALCLVSGGTVSAATDQFWHKGIAYNSSLGGTSYSLSTVVISAGAIYDGNLNGQERIRIWSRNSQVAQNLGFTPDTYNFLDVTKAWTQFGGTSSGMIITGTDPQQPSGGSNANVYIAALIFDWLSWNQIPTNTIEVLTNAITANDGVHVTNPTTTQRKVEIRGSDLPIELPTAYSSSQADQAVQNQYSGFTTHYAFSLSKSYTNYAVTAKGGVYYSVYRYLNTPNYTSYGIASGTTTINHTIN